LLDAHGGQTGDFALSPSNALVESGKLASHPSWWLEDVRSLTDQYGQVMGRFLPLVAGASVQTGSLTALRDGCWMPTQSLPVSPPQ
jgi:hypothetical protein